jgi:transcriptional regulator with XRE-family HTH domain
MSETSESLGSSLRRERERRGITLKAISDQTKVSVSLLEGLEADDLSRWPGGIFRRAFVRGYAAAIGLEPDEIVRRFEEQHKPPAEENLEAVTPEKPADSPPPEAPVRAPAARRKAPASPRRVRLLATAADLTVALVLGLGSAAAGSRLLWPVLLIASYYALGSLLTGRTPMTALLGEESGEADAETAPTAPSAPKPVVRNGGLREAAPSSPRRLRRQRRTLTTEQRR